MSIGEVGTRMSEEDSAVAVLAAYTLGPLINAFGLATIAALQLGGAVKGVLGGLAALTAWEVPVWVALLGRLVALQVRDVERAPEVCGDVAHCRKSHAGFLFFACAGMPMPSI